MKDKKVLITGGAGFIGCHLAKRLIDSGADITIADLISKIGTTKIDDIKDFIKIIDFDISNKEDYKKLETDFDYIFHLAGLASPSIFEKNPELGFKINVDGTENMLNFAAKTSVKKFIFPSSGVVYGKYPKYLPIDENHPIDISQDKYAQSKKMGEDLCKAFLENNDVPTLVFRLFSIFGPRQAKEYLIPTIILQAIRSRKIEIWNDKPTRDFTYIENLLDEFILGAESDYKGGPLNAGNGVERRISDVVKYVASKFDATVTSLNKEVLGPMRLCSDNSLAKRVLGWKTKISFEEGLDRTIMWFQENNDII